MRYMAAYDMMEATRNMSAWLGSTARTFGSFPATALAPHPMFKLLSAWGEVTERSFGRMITKPDWNIPTMASADGHDMIVEPEVVLKRPFGDLVRFNVHSRAPMERWMLRTSNS